MATVNADVHADVVVIGAGHNGLAAAIILAEAGRRVVVLERNERPGGAVRTEEVTLPGFRHDLMATNLNLFAGSPFFATYGERLAAHGLELAPSPKPVCSVFPDDGYVGLSTDLDETLASIATCSAADADAFRTMRAEFDRVAPHLFPLLGVPLPSRAAVRQVASAARHLGRGWPLEFGRLVAQSPRQFVEEHFESREVQALAASWGMHLDFAPNVPGGALFPFLETMACQANGMVLAAGGADRMIDAMVGLLAELGGEVRCSAAVEQVEVVGGAATAAVTADGSRYVADEAVIANLSPTVLFGGAGNAGGSGIAGLVDRRHVGERFGRKVDAYRYGPGTVMIHLALSGPVPWRRAEAAEHMYVHIGPFTDDMDLAYQQATAGLIPERPTLVVGQPTVVDPSRAPDGRHVLWVQARLFPAEIRGDAAGEIDTTEWGAAAEPVAHRVMTQLAEYAPGLDERVLARHVISPRGLEAINPNLVGGDSLGGSHHPMQNFAFRPFPGWSKYRTPVERLFMCGASTWPGAGVGAGSGQLLGSMLTRRTPADRARNLLRR